MPDLLIRICTHVIDKVLAFLGWGTGVTDNYLDDVFPIIWGHFYRMKIENGSPVV